MGYLYHETRRDALASILADGLRPMSHGQWFVNEDTREVMQPGDFTKRELRSCPREDLVPRTYVRTFEPNGMSYGDILLRFPRDIAPPTQKHDVDWYIKKTIPPEVLEMRLSHDEWVPILAKAR